MKMNGAPRKTYLRQTLFQPGKDPITTVIAKGDLKEDIHVVANGTRQMFGTLADVEIFEWEGDLISASVEGHRRATAGRIPETEGSKAILHDYLISAFFLTNPKGVIAPTCLTPLQASDIKAVLEQAKIHPEYQGQTVLLMSQDEEMVRLSNGTIAVEVMQ